MTAFPGEFDDRSEERGEPPLPPEYRFWRHPSELDPMRLDPQAAGRRWLLSHPSRRRSILTAGLVGALIASGATAMVTHLVDDFGNPVRPAVSTTLSTTVAPIDASVSVPLAASIAHVAKAMATVQVARAGSTFRAMAVVIRSDGMLLVPELAVAGSQGILVTLADGSVYVGYLVGTDAESGLAVVRINGANGLPTIVLSRGPVAAPSFAVAVTAPGEHFYSLGTVHALSSPVEVNDHRLVGALTTDLSPTTGPLGSPLLSSAGAVEGIVTGSSPGGSFFAPAWLALTVARDLMATGTVTHGWLGIQCQTNPGKPAGVRIVSVSPRTALAAAGVRAGSVIVDVNRVPVPNVAALEAALYALAPGARVSLRIEVSGAMSTRVVVLAASPGRSS